MERIRASVRFWAFLGLASLGTCALPAQSTGLAWQRLHVFDASLQEAMTYDTRRDRLVSVAGRSNQKTFQTWERISGYWVLRDSPLAPIDADRVALVYDSNRSRCVLVCAKEANPWTTWEWDGIDWRFRAPLPVTSSGRCGLAYDPIRGRTVFVAKSLGTSLMETWEWDGSAWLAKSLSVQPPPRVDPGLTFDPVTETVLLFGGGGLSDTWLWNGATWTQSTPPHSPPADPAPALAADPVLRRCVLYGTTSGETWEWDGATWLRAQVASPPGTARDVAMVLAHDAARGRVVLDGSRSSVARTWEWDGVRWSPIPDRDAPIVRAESSTATDVPVMIYDPVRNRCVLHDLMHSETWEWTGSAWSRRAVAAYPPARSFHALAYDPVRQRVVAFGGINLPTETWEWDGATWTQAHPVTSPPARSRHAMAFDPVGQRVLLFGGYGAAGFLSDTWAYDGSTWAQLASPSAPSARYLHAMCTDPQRQRILLQGGLGNSKWIRDTWEWDGSAWIERFPQRDAGTRYGQSMCYDEGRQRIVTWGGEFSGAIEAEWDGTNWTWGTPGQQPLQRFKPALCYDRARDRVIAFGGFDLVGTPLSDTWAYGAVSAPSLSAYGTGCGGAFGVPALGACPPFLGNDRFLIDVSRARPSSACIVGLSRDAQSLPMLGCTLLLLPPIVPALAQADARGFATVRLALPHDRGLLGAPLHAQAFVADPTAGLHALAVSAGLRFVVGD